MAPWEQDRFLARAEEVVSAAVSVFSRKSAEMELALLLRHIVFFYRTSRTSRTAVRLDYVLNHKALPECLNPADFEEIGRLVEKAAGDRAEDQTICPVFCLLLRLPGLLQQAIDASSTVNTVDLDQLLELPGYDAPGLADPEPPARAGFRVDEPPSVALAPAGPTELCERQRPRQPADGSAAAQSSSAAQSCSATPTPATQAAVVSAQATEEPVAASVPEPAADPTQAGEPAALRQVEQPAEEPRVQGPAVEQPAEEPRVQGQPGEEPAEEPQAEEPPGEEPPAEEPPVEEQTADEPVEKPQAEEQPAEEQPAEEPPVEEPQTEEQAADEPVEEPHAEERHAEERHAEEPPAEEQPAEEPPVEEPQAEDQTVEEPQAEELPDVEASPEPALQATAGLAAGDAEGPAAGALQLQHTCALQRLPGFEADPADHSWLPGTDGASDEVWVSTVHAVKVPGVYDARWALVELATRGACSLEAEERLVDAVLAEAAPLYQPPPGPQRRVLVNARRHRQETEAEDAVLWKYIGVAHVCVALSEKRDPVSGALCEPLAHIMATASCAAIERLPAGSCLVGNVLKRRAGLPYLCYEGVKCKLQTATSYPLAEPERLAGAAGVGKERSPRKRRRRL